MQAITSHLATHLLLIHMVLGCCFHHAHACERECCPEPAASVQACGCDDHGADVQEAADSAGIVGDLPKDRGDRHQHQCEGDHCRFVVVDRTPEQDRPSKLPPRAHRLALVSRRDDAAGKTFVAGTIHSHTTSGFSLRAHLRLHVLLI